MLATFARLAVGDGLGGISVVAFLAVVTVSARSEVTTLEADAPAHATTQLVQLHVEAAAASVTVTVAR